jgi:hypothetical protein
MSVEGARHRSAAAGPVTRLPAPYPWCLACGFEHSADTHCDGCTGDHSGGYCLTGELVAELGQVGELQERVTREADRLFGAALQAVRQEGGV